MHTPMGLYLAGRQLLVWESGLKVSAPKGWLVVVEQVDFSHHQKLLQLGGDGKTVGAPLVARTEETHGDRERENICALQDWNQNVFTWQYEEELVTALATEPISLASYINLKKFHFLYAWKTNKLRIGSKERKAQAKDFLSLAI